MTLHFGLDDDPSEPFGYPDDFYQEIFEKCVQFLEENGLREQLSTIRQFRGATEIGYSLNFRLSSWPDEHRDRLVRLIKQFLGFNVVPASLPDPDAEIESASAEPDGRALQIVRDFDRRMDTYLASSQDFPPNARQVFSLKEQTGREDDSMDMQEFVSQSVRPAATLDKDEQRAARILLLFQEIAGEGTELQKVTFSYLRQIAWREKSVLKDLRGFFGQVLDLDILPPVCADYVRQIISGQLRILDNGDQHSLITTKPGPYNLPLGLADDGKTVFYQGDASIITIAPQGSGKTLCHAIPTLVSYLGPAIVLDIKGDCHKSSAAWRTENVGPVFVFNPTDPTKSARYNPLAFISEDEDDLWEDSRLLADLLVTVSNSKDPVWETQGKDLLTLLVAVVTLTEPLETRTMTRILDYVATIGLSEMLENVAKVDSPFPGAMRRTAARFNQMSVHASKQFEGVLGGISQHLHLWEGSKIERVTSTSDWRPEDFRRAPFPTLYLNVPPDAISTYAPLMRVIIGQHVRRLMRKLEPFTAPILFMLDEMPRLGFMAPIREALEVGRSYGIKLWMIAQYREQLIDAYPGVGDGMIESCAAQLYMNPRFKAAERLSKEFGESKHLFEEQRKMLLDPVDMTGPQHKDSIFARIAGEDGLILKKAFYRG